VARCFDAESTAIQLRSGGFDTIALRATTTNYNPWAQQQYVAYFHKLDPFTNGWRAIGTPGIFFGRELVDPKVLLKSEIYNDYCRGLGIFHTLGAGVDVGSDTNLILGVHRPIEQKDFGAADRSRLELVLPPLARAAQIHALLKSAGLQRSLASEMLTKISVAAIVVDGQCRVLFANDAADQLLKAGDGLNLQQARLKTRDPRQDAILQQAVTRVSATTRRGAEPPSDVLAVRRAHRRPLSVLVAPFWREAWHWTGGSADPSAIIFANDPDVRRYPAIRALTTLYRLTPAEARLREALLQGERVADYAERVGVSTNTAATQLKQIFAKTETRRQADLMRLIFSNPIPSLAKGG
jgi:DNA-binding CsgD family transcriptional regulator